MNEFEWQLLEDKAVLDHVEINGYVLRQGDRVRLRPRKGGDVMDIALAGQFATIEAIEQDYEGKCHLSVVLDDDPGRDMGMLRQPGHRFFFDPAEVEVVPPGEAKAAPVKARILVAGIGNIFLGDDGFGVEVSKRLLQRGSIEGVKVVDFGIAKAERSNTKTQVGFFKGKAAYMAPEQLEGGPIDRRVDVFTTGIVLWELLTGKKLMAAESTAKTLMRLLRDPVPLLSEVLGSVDPTLERIVDRALQRDPAARYQTAGEMRDALEQYLVETRHPVRHEEIGRLVGGAPFREGFDAVAA